MACSASAWARGRALPWSSRTSARTAALRRLDDRAPVGPDRRLGRLVRDGSLELARDRLAARGSYRLRLPVETGVHAPAQVVRAGPYRGYVPHEGRGVPGAERPERVGVGVGRRALERCGVERRVDSLGRGRDLVDDELRTVGVRDVRVLR